MILLGTHTVTPKEYPKDIEYFEEMEVYINAEIRISLSIDLSFILCR